MTIHGQYVRQFTDDTITEWRCIACGVLFTRTGIVRKKPKYCSKTCYSKQYMDHWRKDNSEHVEQYAREYRSTHRDERQAASAKYRAEHPDYFKQWRSANRHRLNELRRIRYHQNPEQFRAACSRWHAENKAKVREAQQRRRAANPEKFRDAMNRWYKTPIGIAHGKRGRARRRSLLRSARSTLTAQQWEWILADYDNCCFYCGESDVNLTQDHFKPLSKGGHHEYGNVVPACAPCNSSKGNRFITEWPGRKGAKVEIKPKSIRKFEPVRIDRPWGYELLWAHTPLYSGKILFYEAGKAGGLQLHREKVESFHLIEGSAWVDSDDGNGNLIRVKMSPGETFNIPAGAPHRFLAITDCLVVETSTPHYDDRVRLEDFYQVEVIGDGPGLPSTKVLSST